jgi:hypothetical protein
LKTNLDAKKLEKKLSEFKSDLLVKINDLLRFLEMKKKAVDYLVANHTKIFKKKTKRLSPCIETLNRLILRLQKIPT